MTPPDPTWIDLTIRWFIFVVLGLTTGLCLGQAIWRRGLRRVALAAYAALAAAAAWSQLSLLSVPVTVIRTVPFLVAAVVQVGYWAVLFFGGLDDEPEAREFAALDADTRDLIRRHPEVLAAFATRNEPDPNVAGGNS